MEVEPSSAGDKIEEFVVDASSGEPEPYYWHSYALAYEGNGVWGCLDSVKWYDSDTEISELSTHFPGVLFKLYGIGEEPEDQWTLYARDGKSYKNYVQFVQPVFDEALLK